MGRSWKSLPWIAHAGRDERVLVHGQSAKVAIYCLERRPRRIVKWHAQRAAMALMSRIMPASSRERLAP
jgi:hypothetical protein